MTSSVYSNADVRLKECLVRVSLKKLIGQLNVYIMDKGYPHETRMVCGYITK